MPEADETIITRFQIEGIDDAVKNALELRKVIDGGVESLKSMKTTLSEIAETAGVSFKEAADAAIKSFKEIENARVEAQKGVADPSEDAEINRQKIANIKQFVDAARQAQKELQIDAKTGLVLEKELINERARAEREGALKRIQIEKGVTEAKRESIRERLRGIQQNVTLQKELDKTTESTVRLGDETSRLGNIAKLVFGSIFGITVIGILRKVRNFFGDVVGIAKDFSQTMFQLEVGINALRRAGLDITLEDALGIITRLRDEFKVFSEVSITAAVAKIAILARNIGVTTDEVEQLTRVSIALAQIMDEDVFAAAVKLTKFIDSGWAIAINRAGIQVNSATLDLIAMEKGLGDNFEALDDTAQAAVRLAFILENLGQLEEDAAKKSEFLAGKIDMNTAAWDNFKTNLGKNLAPVINFLVDSLGIIVRGLDLVRRGLVEFGVDLLVSLGLNLAAVGIAANMMWKNLSGQGEFGVDDFLQALRDVEVLLREEAESILGFTTQAVLGLESMAKSMNKMGKVAEEALALARKALERFKEEFDDLELAFDQKFKDLFIDLNRDLDKIALDGHRRREDLERKHQRRLADIALKAVRAIADARRQLAFSLAQIDNQRDTREADAREKFRLRELAAEEDFNEKMKRLQEEFLFDLGEAIQERDAKQILRLIRRRNLTEKQETRGFELDKEQRERAFKDEIRRIREQADQRRLELLLEFQRRIVDIRTQEQRENADAELRFQQDQVDAERRETERRDDRLKRFDQDEKDLHASFIRKAAIILDGIQQEFNLTKLGLEKLQELLNGFYGKGGVFDRIFDFYRKNLASLSAFSFGKGQVKTDPIPPKQAKGGTFFADTPTTVTFGEAGPEVATFIPLGATTPTPKGLGIGRPSAELSGELSIGISLDSGLVAEIMENTLDEVANVVVSVSRGRGR